MCENEKQGHITIVDANAYNVCAHNVLSGLEKRV